MGVCLLLSCSCRWFDGKTDLWFSPRGWGRGNNWRASSVCAVVSFNNCQMLPQVELCICHTLVYVCVTVLSNFDWKTCLTSCDFSQPFRAYVQHCRPMRLTSIKWHKRHNKQLLSRAVRQSLRQSVAQSVSQSTSRGVGILSQAAAVAAAAACLAAAYGA